MRVGPPNFTPAGRRGQDENLPGGESAGTLTSDTQPQPREKWMRYSPGPDI